MSQPEHWSVDAGAGDVATLDVPPDARRDRVFEIDCRLVVDVPEGAAAPWHAMHVTVDGAREWSRRVPSHAGGDSLDLRLRREVPAGRALRVVASTEVSGARRRRLTIAAEEA